MDNLAASTHLAWFGGRLATGLIDLRTAAGVAASADLLGEIEQGGGWWAIVAEYSGALTAARFESVRARPLPSPSHTWPGLTSRWDSSLNRDEYVAACRQVRQLIAAGEVYQVNVCRVLEHDLPPEADMLALGAALQAANPAPYAGVVRLPGVEVVTASPELFWRRAGREVTTGPIKGTATVAESLQPKDIDENVMIVDMVRNDLSQVCVPGTVDVVDLLAVEQHPGLVHLVSRVRGTLRTAAGWQQLWAASMPPASVTGAPRSSAIPTIASVELTARGPYCGAIGWIDADTATAEIAVAIRTFWTGVGERGQRVLRFGCGAGITWGSDPVAEWAETELKARHLVQVATTGGATPAQGAGPGVRMSPGPQ